MAIRNKNLVTIILFLILSSGLWSMPPSLVTVSLTHPLCIGVEDGAIVINATGTGTLQYSIDNGVNFQSSNIFTALPAGTYDVVVQDVTGTTNQQVILIYQKSILASFTPDVAAGPAELTVNFNNTSVGATDYAWNLDGMMMNSTLTHPVFTYEIPGTYPVTLIASDNNCLDTAYDTIRVSGSSEILDIPNVFSPNNDGINDVFFIPSIGIEVMEVFVFNRYGEIVYEWYGRNGFWDGYTYPAGQPVPDGTYFYQVKATGFDQTEYFKTGILTLLRSSFSGQ
jgi:gliding motility-associated-like protein